VRLKFSDVIIFDQEQLIMTRLAGREISEEEGVMRLMSSSTICVGAGGGENFSVLVSVDVPLVTLTTWRAGLFLMLLTFA
jgi:hypothetical protein